MNLEEQEVWKEGFKAAYAKFAHLADKCDVSDLASAAAEDALTAYRAEHANTYTVQVGYFDKYYRRRCLPQGDRGDGRTRGRMEGHRLHEQVVRGHHRPRRARERLARAEPAPRA